MEIKQPRLGVDKMAELERLYKFMYERGQVTREDVANFMGVCDRQGREAVKILKRKHPIISLSSQKGYRVAKGIEDLEDARHAIKENESKSRENLEPNRKLREFIQKFEEKP